MQEEGGRALPGMDSPSLRAVALPLLAIPDRLNIPRLAGDVIASRLTGVLS